MRRARVFAVQEEAVNGRPRARNIRAERAQRTQLVGQWRRREIVRWQRHEVARPPDSTERVEQRGTPLLVAVAAAARVERGEHVARRRLDGAVRQHEQDPVVLRQVERRQLRTVRSAELRAVGEEVRDVSPELARQVV